MLALVLLALSLFGANVAPSGSLVILSQVLTATSPAISFGATFNGVPNTSHPEVSVTCSSPYFLDVQAAPDGGDKDTPWTVTFGGTSGYAYPPQGDQCSALLYYYVWKGGHEVGRVDLATLSFST